MKLLMTSDTVGGVWTYSLQLAKALQPHDVRVALAAKGALTGDQRAAAEAIPNLTLFVENFKLEWMDDPWSDVDAAGEWLLELAGTTEADLVHLNDYCHGALKWEVPTVMVGHSCVMSWLSAVDPEAAGGPWERYRARVTQGLQAADWILAPTHAMLSQLRMFYGPLTAASVIYNGCEPPCLPAEEKCEVVFSAGRMWDKAKNLATLAAAAPEIRWPVEVAGMPHPHTADERPAEVCWLGRLTPGQMMQQYTRSAIYCLPALYEPFGLTPLEAALHGCALVLGDIPTLREIWGDAALFVDPRDPRALSAAVNRLIDQPALREHFASRAGQIARRLTADRMAAQYYQLYSRLIGTRTRLAAV